ncbi:hypothetical protein CES85_4817 [Ochrobactrum quorumnocens]|uniref:Uncharacterized protein n=1 Tax=Ochrobactrum quorumnocens TaxID=271865 RepID=A0A248UBI1_9HYPH|nr:hypothetical protein CES85_4817 [[Ochrobactrum] quorumnocens]
MEAGRKNLPAFSLYQYDFFIIKKMPFCVNQSLILNIFNVGYSEQYLISINENILAERILQLFGM